MNPHLFVDISSHGFGHLAQTAPVLAEVRRHLPNLHLTIRCGLAKRMLLTRIEEPFTHIREMSDFGFVQSDAISIDHAATILAYHEAHADWAGRVAAEAAFLQRLKPDLVLSNVAYLPLAGAKAAGIPAVAMSSLNWLILVRYFYGEKLWAEPILRQMVEAYANAQPFFALTPAMPMGDGMTVQPVGVVARQADPAARKLVRAAFQIGDDECLVLVAMGGFDMDIPTERWPVKPGLRYLLPRAWDSSHPAAVLFDQTENDFAELLQAADAVLTKPGYGTFTEAACNGTALLYVRRDDWPEQDALIAWLTQQGRCREVSRAALEGEAWLGDLEALLAELKKPAVEPLGIAEVAGHLLAMLQTPR